MRDVAMSGLWPHQSAGLAKLRLEFQLGHRRVLGIAPTGSGKTVMGSEMCRGAISIGNRVLWIAHTTELVDQAANAFRSQNLHVGILQSDRPATPEAPIQIATIQTLVRRPPPPAQLIIVDEAHLHVDTNSINRVLQAYPDAWIVGLTASPYRLDGRSLKAVYQSMVIIAQPSVLLKAGILVPCRVFGPSIPDLRKIRTVDGDYERKKLAVACNKPKIIGEIVDTYQRLCTDQSGQSKSRQAILFAVNIQHSLDCCAAFNAAGITAEHVDGKTPDAERLDRIARFKAGKIQVLCNVEILTTGFDHPDLSCVIVARPTKSLALWLQMTGRGSRSSKLTHKTDCIIQDHSGNFIEHGLPLEDREWVLEEFEEPKPRLAPLKTCPGCFAVLPAHMQTCPECGMGFMSVPEPVRTAPGELGEVKYSQLDKRKYFDELCVAAVSLRQSREYVKNVFKSKFGHYPRGFDWPSSLPLDIMSERAKLERIAERYGYGKWWVEKQLEKKSR